MSPSFEKLTLVARSASSRVYHARDNARAIEVAVKCVDPEHVHALEWEAQVLNCLAHACIPPLIEFGVDSEGAWLSKPWIEGATLDERVQQQVLSEMDCLKMIQEVLAALVEIHAAGFAHSDITTTNVLLTTDGAAAVLDFGNATRLDAQAPHLTGSIYHMAPELFDHEPPSVRSDLYAVGVLAYFALTGVFPFAGDSAAQVITAHHRMRPVPLGQRCQIAAGFASWVDQLLARQPDQRPASALMAMQQLAAVLQS